MMQSDQGSGSSMGIASNDAVTQMLDNDPDAARSYLFYRWFSEWMETIREEREAQGLTQQEIAERLNTTQSSVARLENDRRGSVSVRRLWEYAFAVGLSPLVELRPSSSLMGFVRNQPDAWLATTEYNSWLTRQALITNGVASGLAEIVASSYRISLNMSNTLQSFVSVNQRLREALPKAIKEGITGVVEAQTSMLASQLDQSHKGISITRQNVSQAGPQNEGQPENKAGGIRVESLQKWAA
jgi:transcriptional regulator with XRE-family HTH domain